jgi:dihydrofolate synthase / folylpolyglutamate synthase
MGVNMKDLLSYLYGLTRFGIKPGLGVITKLLHGLDNPHKKFKSIHVAGTNGKGSVAAMLSSVLQEAGYTTGLYTSPHMIRFNERIQINGQEITDKELLHHVQRIKETADALQVQPTFFEFTTALAFLHFAETVDVGVIEVGMGGRWDATNVITPEVSVITTIALDHVQYLGNTTVKIASEKAGIIKLGIPVIVGVHEENLIEVFRDVCAEKKSRLVEVQKSITTKILNSNLSQQTFTTEGMISEKFSISLLGEHQVANAAMVLTTVATLRTLAWNISEDALQSGLQQAVWPGRLQIVCSAPLLMIDGAHNLAAVKALCKFLMTLPQGDTLVLGVKKGKPIKDFARLLVPLFRKVIVTQGNFEPEDPLVLAEAVKPYCSEVCVEPDLQNAVELALTTQGRVLFTGSLYMIGDALGILKNSGNQRIYQVQH